MKIEILLWAIFELVRALSRMLECNLEVASKKLGACALGKLSGFLDVKKTWVDWIGHRTVVVGRWCGGLWLELLGTGGSLGVRPVSCLPSHQLLWPCPACALLGRCQTLFAKSDHVVTLIAGTARCGVMWRVSRICCHFLWSLKGSLFSKHRWANRLITERMLEHHYSDYLYGSPEGECLATSKTHINKSLLDRTSRPQHTATN